MCTVCGREGVAIVEQDGGRKQEMGAHTRVNKAFRLKGCSIRLAVH